MCVDGMSDCCVCAARTLNYNGSQIRDKMNTRLNEKRRDNVIQNDMIQEGGARLGDM